MARPNLVRLTMQVYLLHLSSVCCAFAFSDSFKVQRSDSDRFLNPDCDSTTCPRICARYDAVCYSTDEYRPCKYCDCNERLGKQTYVGNGKNGGRCVADADLVTDSASKEKVLIASHLPKDITTKECLIVDPDLILKHDCFNTREYSWIYTENRQFMNLNKLDCLSVSSENKVIASPCTLSGEKQQWYCDDNGTLFYREKSGSPKMYIGGALALTDSIVQTWNIHQPTKDHRTLCEKPVEYQGCYRFNDGSLTRYLDYYPTTSDGDCASSDAKVCFTTIKVLAPIYAEHAKCLINWANSSFLINNDPWQLVSSPDSDITVFDAENSRGIYVKVPYASYKKWSGTVVKLQVKCFSQTSSEEHCVLLKFAGGGQDGSSNSITTAGNRTKSNKNAYKISTIVLAVLLFILLVAVLVYFAIRKNVFSPLTRRNSHGSRSGEIAIFVETDGDEPQM